MWQDEQVLLEMIGKKGNSSEEYAIDYLLSK